MAYKTNCQIKPYMCVFVCLCHVEAGLGVAFVSNLKKKKQFNDFWSLFSFFLKLLVFGL